MTAIAATPRRTFQLVHGDVSFHGLVNTYSRIVFGQARIQILIIQGDKEWVVQTDYGPDPNDYYCETHTDEGTAMLAFLAEIVKWEKQPDPLFINRVRYLRRNTRGDRQ